LKKGKEEIYLGLEKVAVAENATHDEDGGLRRRGGMGDCVVGREVIYIFRQEENIKSIKKKHRILISRLRPISVSRAPWPVHRPFLPFSTIPLFRVLIAIFGT
jgi:hypothetical protein